VPKLLGQLRRVMRAKHMSPRTEEAYVAWVRRYVRFCGWRHPDECGPAAVRAFLESLATERGVAAPTQNQAYAALLFLYEQVLRRSLGALPAFVRARRTQRVPNVLEPDEVSVMLHEIRGRARLVVMLLYGAGLRVNEAVRLRVKDVDLRRRVLTVRDAKGGKDRRTVLPDSLSAAMTDHVRRVRARYLRDATAGGVRVPLPHAMDRKSPAAASDWRWGWLFPSTRTYVDRESGVVYRDHMHKSTVQRAVAGAARRSGLNKRVTAHTFRHSFATHMLRNGYDVRTVQELLGHSDVRTTMVYLHVLERGVGVRSPLDRLSSS
jgi:integron integrase